MKKNTNLIKYNNLREGFLRLKKLLYQQLPELTNMHDIQVDSQIGMSTLTKFSMGRNVEIDSMQKFIDYINQKLQPKTPFTIADLLGCGNNVNIKNEKNITVDKSPAVVREFYRSPEISDEDKELITGMIEIAHRKLILKNKKTKKARPAPARAGK